jgi:uncharacterized protein
MGFPKRRNGRCPFRKQLCLLLILFFFAGLNACAKKPIIVPPISPEPTHVRHVGKFVWYDLFTHDLESTGRFYAELFGWTFSKTTHGGKRVKTIEQEGVPIGNAILIDPKKHKAEDSGWLSYISVDDVDDATELVTRHKGSIQMLPKDLPERGRVSVVKDPEGAVFALVTAAGGDPQDQDPIINNWLGSELWARNPSAALAFYQMLVDYEIKMVDNDSGPSYRLLIKDGETRGGIVEIPWEGIEPNWLPYIVVEDADAIMQKASELGGAILIAPDEAIRKGAVSIIADPSGAVFAVQQF